MEHRQVAADRPRPTPLRTSGWRRRVSGILGLVVATTSVASCSDDPSSVTVSELLDQEPAGEVRVRGGLYALGFEYFGPEGAGWEFDVALCDSVTVRLGEREDEVECAGASVELPSALAESEDLDWNWAPIETLYLEDVEVTGQLRDGALVVSEVIVGGTSVAPPDGTEPDDQDPPQTTTTSGEPPLPIEQAEGEDLYGLRSYVRGTPVVYLARDDFVSRVAQLRANCESSDRLQDIVDRTSGRGPEIPQDVVTQHHFVCPDVVADLTLPADVALPSGP